MINPEDYRVTPETVDGGDVDVDAEVVLGLDGRRITEADIQAWRPAVVAGTIDRGCRSGCPS